MVTDIHTLADNIAANLGDGWTCEPPKEEFGDRVAYLRHQDGHGLRLSRNWRDKTRLVICGTHPRTRNGQQMSLPYGKTDPEITCAIGRSAVVIAKEIERRFLPPYLELWREMAERARSHDAHEDGVELAKLKIMAAVPVNFDTHAHDKTKVPFRFKNGGDFYGNVEVFGPNSVDVKIHGMSLGRALDVLRALLGPRDFAKEIAGIDALMVKEEVRWQDVRGTLSDTGMERFDKGHERLMADLRNRRAELLALRERIRGLEVEE